MSRPLDLKGRVIFANEREPTLDPSALNTLYELLDGDVHLALPLGNTVLANSVPRTQHRLELIAAYFAGSEATEVSSGQITLNKACC